MRDVNFLDNKETFSKVIADPLAGNQYTKVRGALIRIATSMKSAVTSLLQKFLREEVTVLNSRRKVLC